MKDDRDDQGPKAQILRLPTLIGTASQVRWATELRATRLAELDQIASNHRHIIELQPHLADNMRVGLRAVEAIRGQQYAAWWIRNRDVSTPDLLKAWLRQHGPAGGGRPR